MSSTPGGSRRREGSSDDGGPRRDYRPAGVQRRSSAFAMLKRTFTEYSEDNMSDWAAALTYYGLLAVFPALIALFAIVGLVGNPASTTHQLIEIVGKLGPSSAKQTFEGPIKALTKQRSAAGILLIVGILGALYSASSDVAAFARASNIIFETPEGRPFWKLKPLQILVTATILVLLLVVALSLALTGPVVGAVASPLGISSEAVSIWDIAKWPVLALLMVVMFTILYYASPNVKMRGFRSGRAGSRVRARGMARGLSAVRVLRGQLRLIQQDLRNARRSGRLPRMDVAHECRSAAGRADERGA